MEYLSENHYTKNDADQKLALALEPYATTESVTKAIEAADISDKLSDYYTKEETYSSGEVDDLLKNVEVDLTGYAKEAYVDGKFNPLSTTVSENTTNITDLGKSVQDIQEALKNVNSTQLTYEIVYDNPEDPNSGENVLVLYEIENEGQEGEIRTPKNKYTITGGGGGSSSANKLFLYFDTNENGDQITKYVFTNEVVERKEAIIYYTFAGEDSVGDSVSSANAKWQIRRGNNAWTTIFE